MVLPHYLSCLLDLVWLGRERITQNALGRQNRNHHIFCHTKRTGERAFFRGSAQRRKEAPLHSAKDVSNILPNDIFFFFFLVCAKTSNERESPIKKEEKKKRKIVPKPVRTQRSSRRIHKTQRGTPFFVLWTQTPPTFCSIDD